MINPNFEDKNCTRGAFTAVIAILFFTTLAYSEPLSGVVASAEGKDWQSSWMELYPPVSFTKKETIKIKVKGDAENVLIRFLPEGSSPDSLAGIKGDVRKVPPNKTLEVILERNHPNVKQISVHAGKMAWHHFLGNTNGNIFIFSIERND